MSSTPPPPVRIDYHGYIRDFCRILGSARLAYPTNSAWYRLSRARVVQSVTCRDMKFPFFHRSNLIIAEDRLNEGFQGEPESMTFHMMIDLCKNKAGQIDYGIRLRSIDGPPDIDYSVIARAWVRERIPVTTITIPEANRTTSIPHIALLVNDLLTVYPMYGLLEMQCWVAAECIALHIAATHTELSLYGIRPQYGKLGVDAFITRWIPNRRMRGRIWYITLLISTNLYTLLLATIDMIYFGLKDILDAARDIRANERFLVVSRSVRENEINLASDDFALSRSAIPNAALLMNVDVSYLKERIEMLPLAFLLVDVTHYEHRLQLSPANRAQTIGLLLERTINLLNVKRNWIVFFRGRFPISLQHVCAAATYLAQDTLSRNWDQRWEIAQPGLADAAF